MMVSKKKSVYYYRYRSSKTGHFISKAEYDSLPSSETERTRVRRKGM